jgi:fucose permease
MPSPQGSANLRTLVVLHPIFALTGIVQALGGPLMPSLAATHHLNDGQSGLLFLCYFAGTSMGAFFCRTNYARAIAFGFFAMVLCSLAVAWAPWPLLPGAFLLLGITDGVPMSGVSLYIGRTFAATCAPTLTMLNFTWSAGALLAPLLASRVLIRFDYRAAFVLLSVFALIAGTACALFLRDSEEPWDPDPHTRTITPFPIVLVFALAAFLQVGIENTSAAWFSTFALRTAGGGMVRAAVSTSFYWTGFLASRGLASIVLLRVRSAAVLRVALVAALCAAVLLAATGSTPVRELAMLALGVSLAPIYPLVLAGFFARARHTSDSRWVLATAGFGGSVLPWIAGWLSVHTQSLRVGMCTIPAALLVMLLVLPLLSGSAVLAGRTE